MNYFNYFTEIEDIFIRRRGKHIFLSPLDWALIESWKERGVPLHVALRGIQKAFDSYESRPRKRSIKTLFYCQEEVEALYADWLDSQVGSNNNGKKDGANELTESDDSALPFPRETILNHLSDAQEFFNRIKEVQTELIFSERAMRVYGYYVIIFYVVLLTDIAWQRKFNREAVIALYGIAVVLIGLPFISYLFPLADLHNTTKRGLFKMFPLILLYMANSSTMQTLSGLVTKWEFSEPKKSK